MNDNKNHEDKMRDYFAYGVYIDAQANKEARKREALKRRMVLNCLIATGISLFGVFIFWGHL